MDDRTVAQIAPSGNFGNTFNINCDNPLLSAQQRGIICDTENLLTLNQDPDGNFINPPLNAPSQTVLQTGLAPFDFIDPLTGQTYNRGFLQPLRRNVEGGPRRDDLQHTSYRFVAGVKGDLSPVWSYDAFYQYGRTNFSETYFNDFSVSRLGRALDVVTSPTTGAPVCRSVLDGSDANCVPYDIFAPGGVSQAAINYLQVPGFQRGINGETVINGSLTGQLGQYGIQSPWSTEGLGIVIGGEYRRETLEFFSDAAFQAGDLAGQGAATLPVAGSFNVKEVFTEARLPIVSQSFFYDLTVTGGYRYSSYNNSAGNSFNTDTYKIEAEFAPIRDIRFRGGYNRAVRAPTIQDLFAPNRVALNGSSDPCAGFAITAATWVVLRRAWRSVRRSPLTLQASIMASLVAPQRSAPKSPTRTLPVLCCSRGSFQVSRSRLITLRSSLTELSRVSGKTRSCSSARRRRIRSIAALSSAMRPVRSGGQIRAMLLT